MENKKICWARIRAWNDRFWNSKYIVPVAGILIIICLAMLTWKASQMVVYTDVSEYGIYTGTGANDFVRDYINSFFPEEIEEFFTDVKYSYKAPGENAYDFEAYLEFTITDADTFEQYVENIAPESAWETFPFDADYRIYMLENRFDINTEKEYDPESIYYYPIEGARIRAVLYHAETQTIIFWALGVYDGGGIGTNCLNTFFTRFGIDPVVYEQTADTPHDSGPYGID